jgi:hypothetical protein
MNEHERCECHDCTQARWRMSFQGQLSAGVVTYGPYNSDGPITSESGSYTVTDRADLIGRIHHWTHSSLKGD